ncbi:RNA pseudouridine synthase 4, mitochondrial-like isoform X2 [Prosopis cineraria]|uniref:RNA pseudouridine synthase 4, mitochondrial-like isoform X2 n=1 Tax=Prosopis cineraria TaxID=364024 RepID=UPI00240FD057|nr:RNA pseudouridine synthase 4, mitochondrial-like isoform X2 [Prosopis cineraria]
MKEFIFLRPIKIKLLSPASSSTADVGGTLRLSGFGSWHTKYYSSVLDSSNEVKGRRKDAKWLTLPPFTPTVNGADLGKALSGRRSEVKQVLAATSSTTALKWVLRCCPELPRSLVQKLFRLRQVRRESASVENKTMETQENKHRLKRDPAILVLNKPSGMPVQGGINISRSLDEVAAACLTYEYSESPRLVHRLDRDCTGILVMGRTHTSAIVLHSIFREKTFRASDDIGKKKRILQRRYLALVIGCPRRPRGLVSASLGKVVVDNGKSDRITIIDNSSELSSQHAITEYRVIGSSSHGYSWLELLPFTGRKHQLRVHCAEVLGTPIVGDYKYGWQAHRRWKHFDVPDQEDSSEDEKALPFGLNMNKGSISEKHPRLHLHCKHVVLPNVSQALQDVQLSSSHDLWNVESLEFVAPLPPYMQRSWDLTKS